jgi:Concanavalin A-like lectin/glucanases superfamily
MKRIFLAVVFLSCAVAAQGATFWVSPSGSTSSCVQSATAPSLAASSNSLSNSIGCLAPGDTLNMRAGTYSCSNCIGGMSGGSGEGSRKTIQGYPGDGNRVVTLNSNIILTGHSPNEKTYITLKNFRLNAAGNQFAIKIDGDSAANIAHHITIDNLEIFGSSSHGIQMPGNQFQSQVPGGNKVLNSEIHHVGTDIRLEHALYVCSNDSVYDNNVIHDACGCGLHVYCSDNASLSTSNNVISNNLFYNFNRPYTHEPAAGTPRGDGVTCNGLNENDAEAGPYSCATGLLVNSTGGSGGAVVFNNRIRDTTKAIIAVNPNSRYFNNTMNNNASCFADVNGGDIRNNICQNSGGCTGANCVTSAPLDSNLKLTSAVGGGQNLTGQNIAGLNVDFEGTPRPATGAWDVGADQFGGGGGSVPSIALTAPACAPTCTVATSTITGISGTASAVSPATVSSVTWSSSCAACSPNSGTATGTTSWSVASIPVAVGATTITFTVTDSNAQSATTMLSVTRSSQAPLAWWKFEEGSGTTAADSSGNGHTGTLVNNAGFGAGKVGTWSLALDGVDDAVTLPDPVLTSFSTDHTVCMWARTTSPTALGGGGDWKQTFLNLSPDGSNGLRWVMVENSTPPGTFIATRSNAGAGLSRGTTTATFQANVWVHLCETLISDTMTLYVNGVVPATVVVTDHYFPAQASVLGARSVSTGSVSGALDEVKIWNRGLTATEVQTEFGGPPGTTRVPRHRSVVE